MQGRPEEARQILIRLHTNRNDPNHELAEAEFFQINKQIAIDRTLGSSWYDMFAKPSYRKRALLAIGTTGIIQSTGVLVINNYGFSIYKALGYSPVKQLLYPAAWLVFALGMNVVGMFLVDRFNRPRYMAAGVMGCMITLIVEAALVANFVPSNNESALQAAVAMFFVYQVFYGACLDGTQFSYLGELFPTHLRAKGVCLGVSMISLMNIMWLQAAPTAFNTIGKCDRFLFDGQILTLFQAGNSTFASSYLELWVLLPCGSFSQIRKACLWRKLLPSSAMRMRLRFTREILILMRSIILSTSSRRVLMTRKMCR